MAVNSTPPSDTGRPADTGIDTVVVAVAEDTPERVVESALTVAADHDADLHALSVVRMTAGVDHWDMVVERREDDAETALDTAADAAATSAHVDLTKHLRYGDPADEIAAYADAVDADLVVLGDPDRSGLRRLLTPATVTARVRRRTTTPVLAVADDTATPIDGSLHLGGDTPA
ncbi:universal stress protein [Halocalculus aciditolerans]|uniref:UspA domain-containing protein n=1 Tax=Halocalculus aciditolerans TaxID=1383812 RepID=A0A830FNU4_9EURY|nr:universal stress protein [Halocalculus aciditolerans]GGL65802.1 hypothetical protein GCM10009039_24630 [Halocalculus aciditolerans]